MAETRDTRCRARLLGAHLLLAVALTILSAPRAFAAESNKSSSDFLERMKKWQAEMSEKFRDTYKELRGAREDRSASSSSASVDLREQNDSYTLRLNRAGA